MVPPPLLRASSSMCADAPASRLLELFLWLISGHPPAIARRTHDRRRCKTPLLFGDCAQGLSVLEGSARPRGVRPTHAQLVREQSRCCAHHCGLWMNCCSMPALMISPIVSWFPSRARCARRRRAPLIYLPTRGWGAHGHKFRHRGNRTLAAPTGHALEVPCRRGHLYLVTYSCQSASATTLEEFIF